MTQNIFADYENNKDKTISLMNGIKSAVVLFTVSSEIRFLHFNHAADRLFGYENGGLNKLTETDSMKLFHPDYEDKLYSEIISTMRDGLMFNCNCRGLCADGSYKWANLSAQLVQQSSGTLYYHGVMTAIGEPDDIQLKGLHALVVAGDKADRSELSELIEKYGGTCDVCQRGLDALDKFTVSEDNFYNCIFVGCRMRGINGFELAKEIRHAAHPQAATLPLVLLIDEDDSSNIRDVGDIGITAYLSKPLKKEKITKWLKTLNK